MTDDKLSRREFLGKTGIGLAALVLGVSIDGCKNEPKPKGYWEDNVDGYNVKVYQKDLGDECSEYFVFAYQDNTLKKSITYHESKIKDNTRGIRIISESPIEEFFCSDTETNYIYGTMIEKPDTSLEKQDSSLGRTTSYWVKKGRETYSTANMHNDLETQTLLEDAKVKTHEAITFFGKVMQSHMSPRNISVSDARKPDPEEKGPIMDVYRFRAVL
jgi:hypothetical protein